MDFLSKENLLCSALTNKISFYKHNNFYGKHDIKEENLKIDTYFSYHSNSLDAWIFCFVMDWNLGEGKLC